MSTFVPDPNLVVEALRSIAAMQDFGLSGESMASGAQVEATVALPHAEAIAELWDWTMPQAAAVQELIAAAKGLEDDLGFPGSRHARLRAALEAVSA